MRGASAATMAWPGFDAQHLIQRKGARNCLSICATELSDVTLVVHTGVVSKHWTSTDIWGEGVLVGAIAIRIYALARLPSTEVIMTEVWESDSI